jgi:hypothetical protein
MMRTTIVCCFKNIHIGTGRAHPNTFVHIVIIMYREMKTKTFVRTPDPPGASRLRY